MTRHSDDPKWRASAPPRVLFVDDETRILDGLRRALRAQRAVCDLRFAAGGAAAIAELERVPADLVVSDMRMPEMDGAAFLTVVRERWPAAVRVVLSGQSDAEAGLAAIRVAHQFLNKPCEHAAIAGLIERAARLCALVPDPVVRARAGALAALAPRPGSRPALERILADPRAGTADVLPVVATDAALAAKVLQLSSTAFFVRTHAFTELETAIACLGIDALRTVAVDGFMAEPAGDASDDWLEAHHAAAVRAARAARDRAQDPHRSGGAYLTGLFANLGALIAATAPAPSGAATDGAKLGAWLLGAWGVPWPLVEAVAAADAGAGSGDWGEIAA